MLNRRSTVQGFSLIELMLAIAILAILTTLSFPSYKAWIQNTRIKTTAASILNGLQIARSEAVRRNAPVQFVLGANSDWTVGCVTVVADPVPPAVTPPGCPATIQSRSTSDGSTTAIIVTPSPAANTTVVFTNLGGLAAAPAPFVKVDVSVSCTVLPAAEAKQLRITLGGGGNARMCDPNVSNASDARACVPYLANVACP